MQILSATLYPFAGSQDDMHSAVNPILSVYFWVHFLGSFYLSIFGFTESTNNYSAQKFLDSVSATQVCRPGTMEPLLYIIGNFRRGAAASQEQGCSTHLLPPQHKQRNNQSAAEICRRYALNKVEDKCSTIRGAVR